MLREREVVARMNGKPLEPCGEFCRLPAERRRLLKLALDSNTVPKPLPPPPVVP